MTALATKPVQAHNGATDTIESKALQQILESVQRALDQVKETYRVRTRSFRDSEVVKIFTMSTDHQLHFSVIRNHPNNVHLKCMRYRSAYQDEVRSGWTTPRTQDYKTGPDLSLDLRSLAVINQQALDWVVLNHDNARTPRETYPTQDGMDRAPSPFVAGTFVVDNVQVLTSPAYAIVLSNRRQGCKVTLTGDQARLFNEPLGMSGCRAVIHHSGFVKILREPAFNTLYSVAPNATH